MKYTSSEAAKLLKKKREELKYLMTQEADAKDFVASVGEDVEELRPNYDYAATQQAEKSLEADIRKIRHAINIFNTTHKVGDMTIDEVLVYLPQLSARKTKLEEMSSRMPRVREWARFMRFGNSPVIDYNYANYDIARALADYRKVSDELAALQTALDVVNTTEYMEIDLEG